VDVHDPPAGMNPREHLRAAPARPQLGVVRSCVGGEIERQHGHVTIDAHGWVDQIEMIEGGLTGRWSVHVHQSLATHEQRVELHRVVGDIVGAGVRYPGGIPQAKALQAVRHDTDDGFRDGGVIGGKAVGLRSGAASAQHHEDRRHQERGGSHPPTASRRLPEGPPGSRPGSTSASRIRRSARARVMRFATVWREMPRISAAS